MNECFATMSTLPDKGAKIKQSIKAIDILLHGDVIHDDIITADNTYCDRESPLTEKLAGMTFLAPRQEARRRSIARANTFANSNNGYVATANAQAPAMTSNRYNYYYPGFVSLPENSTMMTTNPSPPSKVCMLSLDESVKLQQDRLRLMNHQQAITIEDSLSDEDDYCRDYDDRDDD
ncbi:hypothetical protein BX666DRAFT_1874333 [Dichotomocladium elegans]|nr:hypothetical protein BX666DRAFT_1874333 [Dichotomocladium elegans]